MNVWLKALIGFFASFTVSVTVYVLLVNILMKHFADLPVEVLGWIVLAIEFVFGSTMVALAIILL